MDMRWRPINDDAGRVIDARYFDPKSEPILVGQTNATAGFSHRGMTNWVESWKKRILCLASLLLSGSVVGVHR